MNPMNQDEAGHIYFGGVDPDAAGGMVVLKLLPGGGHEMVLFVPSSSMNSLSRLIAGSTLNLMDGLRVFVECPSNMYEAGAVMRKGGGGQNVSLARRGVITNVRNCGEWMGALIPFTSQREYIQPMAWKKFFGVKPCHHRPVRREIIDRTFNRISDPAGRQAYAELSRQKKPGFADAYCIAYFCLRSACIRPTNKKGKT